jgi:proteasome lid subunit RPN8/RPN11
MIKIKTEMFNKMVSYAKEGAPNEVCGLFAGNIKDSEKTISEIYYLHNVDESPEHFSMAPEDQFAAIKDIREKNIVLLGNFHSHPASPARPSQEDIRLAFDPTLSYIIISLDGEPVLKSFNIDKKTNTVKEEEVCYL